MSLRTIRGRAVLAASACLLLAGLAQAGNVDVRVNGAPYRLHVVSLKEARFQTTVPQQYDFSCGSAATATLLTYQYGIAVTESEVFMQMYQRGDQEKIRQRGFSLLDMRRYLQSRGFEADGFEQPLDKLFKEGLPAIVLLNDRGYKHFVVIKGIRNGRVLLGDPARGTRAMPRSRFEELWDNKILFVVHNRRELAGFNLARDWRTAPPAPLDAGIARDSLYNIVTPRKRPGDI
ncbi:C39 family peptidase [Lysobacter sp. TAF61]|uniref:C39 family peptidase n=1 Tax=Lysobacter sp. TAF61 TaxID=3233072 RepID=UPI003F9D9E31